MCLDIIKGLLFLHNHSIIHRDLKTDNIFVTLNERKEINQLAIGDFDTAKKVGKSGYAKTILGTPGYIAPEVLRANETSGYSFKADVYSFGIVLYEILTLKLPFEDYPQFNVPDMVMKGIKPAIPSDILDSSYSELIDLFITCTSSEPSLRPSTTEIKDKLIAQM